MRRRGTMATPRSISIFRAALFGLTLAALLPAGRAAASGQDGEYGELREKMVQEQIAEPPDYRDPVKDPQVLEAMRQVRRHLYVKPADRERAYGDHPIPIGYGQTISQPYIVALMTEMLEVKPDHRVLEVGTGSGYQAAVLAHLVDEVYTVEIVKALSETASERLERLGYDNVHVRNADGFHGWTEHAPYDRILVTAAASLVPPPLIRQLEPGGRMCIPVGGQYSVQYLTLVEKSEDGQVTMRKELPVRFVPLTRKLR
jgi:protein-L-isoaspartate(D-aspartate) O-methyltransferase